MFDSKEWVYFFLICNEADDPIRYLATINARSQHEWNKYHPKGLLQIVDSHIVTAELSCLKLCQIDVDETPAGF